jgi:hypothetical protein
LDPVEERLDAIVSQARRGNPFQGRSAFQARRQLRKHFVFGLTNQLSPRTVIPIRPLGYELLEVGVFGEDSARQPSQRELPLTSRSSCIFAK